MQTFEHDPKAGIVGPLFLGSNNVVQKAGGLIYDSGKPANHGRNKPMSHRLAFLRQADYISAACIVMRKEMFVRLGGFDPQVRYLAS